MYRFCLKVYQPLAGLPAVFFTRRLCGGLAGCFRKCGCCEEKCTPIMIRDTDKFFHLIFLRAIYHLTSVNKFDTLISYFRTKDPLYTNVVQNTIPYTKS